MAIQEENALEMLPLPAKASTAMVDTTIGSPWMVRLAEVNPNFHHKVVAAFLTAFEAGEMETAESLAV